MVGPRPPREPGVDDDPHPRHRQARLGDRRRQHDAAAFARPAEHGVLVRRVLPAVQRQDLGVHAGPTLHLTEAAGDVVDLPATGQEHEHVTGRLGHGPSHHRGHVVEERRLHPHPARRRDGTRGRAPDDVDGVHRVGGGDDGSVEGDRQVVGGRRGGRREQAQVRAQGGARVDAEGQREVGVEVALVALVEDDGVDALELRVALQSGHEQPRRDDLHPGLRSGAPLTADRVADAPAHRLAEQPRHPLGRGADGDAARLGDEDPPADRPGQREGHQRRLAGTGGSDEDGGPALVQRGLELRERRAHRQVEVDLVDHTCRSTSRAPRIIRAG